MKLWEKNIDTDKAVMKFTVGNDPEMDRLLAPCDVIASMAHAIMLGETEIITKNEARKLTDALSGYYPVVAAPGFTLNEEDEDIHSHLEKYLVNMLGETGKKIHAARSRNDQVMVALLLYIKESWNHIINEIKNLTEVLITRAEEHRDVRMPGYTHLQVAMPSSFGLWLGAYAETLLSDLELIRGVIVALDRNPLGSAAGYGTSFPIDRDLTTRLLGFGAPMISSVSAQLGRGKLEMQTACGLGAVASTLSRFASDCILFMGQNFNFISFPEALTTGSSIMPHKKNPDVLELVRARCNRIISISSTLGTLTANLTSGYHRDFQLIKEILMPAFASMKECLEITVLMARSMQVHEGILEDEKYEHIYSVEEVNRKVMQGKSFRDAYREVAAELGKRRYRPGQGASYSHLGSIGNPGIERIAERTAVLFGAFSMTALTDLYEQLSNYYSKK